MTDSRHLILRAAAAAANHVRLGAGIRDLERFAIDLALVVLIAGFVHVAWLAGCLITRRYRLAASSILTASMLGIVLGLAEAVRWAATDHFPLPRFDLLVVPAALGVWVAMRLGVRLWRRRESRPVASHLVYAAAHLLLLAAAGWQFRSATAFYQEPAAERRDYPMVAAGDAVLVTDQGRIFSVFHFDPRDKAVNDRYFDFLPTYVDALTSQQSWGNTPGRPARLASLLKVSRVKVAPPDLTANCHGWVFAGGRYALSPTTVEALLQDNGYSRVAEPRPGDVVVYRDEAGGIVHSGRVRRVNASDEVWIESKWGTGAAYIHHPLDQCYSGTLEYYRSARRADEAQIVQSAPAKASNILSLRRQPVVNSG